MRFTRLLLITAALAAACADAPTAVDNTIAPQFSNGAERVVEQVLYDMSGSHYTFACSPDGEPLPLDEGELVAIEGQVLERIVHKTDGAGGVHFQLNTMPVGLSGTGLESGEEF